MEEKGFLEEREAHPAASSAADYIKSLGYIKMMQYFEVFASVAMENNRTAEICHETLRRIINKEPVSDRYLLGLAWTIKEIENKKDGE